MTTNRTRKAVRHLIDAHAECSRGEASSAYRAGRLETQAAELLALGEPLAIGAGGEAIPEPGMVGATTGRAILRETLREGATRIAADASCARAELLLEQSSGVLPMALDAAEAMGAESSPEKMLGHQLALAHDAALRLMSKAMQRAERDAESVEAARLANTAARLLSVYQDGLLTLQRLRTGGAQTVTVQHVNVQAGAQAVVGNVTAGGPSRRRGRG